MAQTSAAAGGSGESDYKPPSSWMVTIEGAIEKEMRSFPETGSVGDRKKVNRAIFRIPKLVLARLDSKDMTYAPDALSVGLFHRPGRRYVPPNLGESFKVRMVCAFLATIFMTEGRRKDCLARLKSNLDFHSQVAGLEAKFNSNAKDEAQTASVKVVRLGLKDHVWQDLCTEVVNGAQGLESIKQRYELDDEDQVTEDESDETIKSSITLDAIAVATGLCVFYLDEKKLFSFELFCGDGSRAEVWKVHFDILKLENQVPLSLLRSALHILYNENIQVVESLNAACSGLSTRADESLNAACPGLPTTKADEALNEACYELAVDFSTRYLPGYDHPSTKVHIEKLRAGKQFLACDHLLGCVSLVLHIEDEKQKNLGCCEGRKLLGRVAQYVHGFYSRFSSRNRALSSRDKTPKPRNFNIPSATRLHEGGMNFRQIQCGDKVDLLPVFKPHWFTATLYIPRLPRLSMLTLTAWKNLVAYESRAVHNREKESQFLALIAFMDCLIDTKEDVLLMTRGRKPVLPDRYGTSPEELAHVFNTILTGFPVPEYARWLALKQEILDYHEQKWKRRLGLDYLRAKFGKLWLFVSLMAASLLLILTCLQTVYAILAFYPR